LTIDGSFQDAFHHGLMARIPKEISVAHVWDVHVVSERVLALDAHVPVEQPA